jgi:hypothetical protein
MKNRGCFRIFILASCMGASSFSQNQNRKLVFQNETVVLGYSARLIKDVDLADAKAVTSVLIQEMLDQWAVHLNSEVIVYEDLSTLKKDIREKKMDIIALTTSEYFILRKQADMIPFMTYKISDRILDRILLVSRRDSGNRSIHDLKRKRIAVYANLNDELNLPNMWLTTLVLKSAENYQRDYASAVYRVRKGTKAISDVFFGNADAAVVPEVHFIVSKEMNPQIGAQMCIVDSSKQVLYSVLCYTGKMTASLNRYKDRNIQSVVDMLCSTDTTDVGRHFLSIFRITGFAPFAGTYLNETEALFNDFKNLTRGKKLYGE